MEINVLPSLEIIIIQLITLIIIGIVIYLCFLLIKAIKIYIKKKFLIHKVNYLYIASEKLTQLKLNF